MSKRTISIAAKEDMARADIYRGHSLLLQYEDNGDYVTVFCNGQHKVLKTLAERDKWYVLREQHMEKLDWQNYKKTTVFYAPKNGAEEMFRAAFAEIST